MTSNANAQLFEPPDPLPRGPHRLTREQVASSQRIRLLGALTELLAERGYAGVTIGELARRAGVSRAAFYEHFADKQDCLLAAYDRFAEAALAGVAAEIDEGQPWSDFVESALSGYLGVLERDPTAARAFIVEMPAAGPVARARRSDAIRGLATLIAERHAALRARDPSLGALPETVYLTLAIGVRELVHEVLATDPTAPLTRYTADLLLMFKAVVAGAAAVQ